MDIYKEASRKRLRIHTKHGNLSVEQLWDLHMDDLDQLAVSLEEDFQSSGRKSFLTKENDKSATAKLKFDVVLDILQTKIDETEKAREKSEVREHNRRIDELILRKKNEELESLSLKELEDLRK